MKIKSFALLLALVFAISAAAQTTPHFDGQTWWDHIKVLADDKLEGRVKCAGIALPPGCGEVTLRSESGSGRQNRGVLKEGGGAGEAAACLRPAGRALELGGDFFVWSCCRPGSMPGS